jgi:hypothetical protein
MLDSRKERNGWAVRVLAKPTGKVLMTCNRLKAEVSQRPFDSSQIGSRRCVGKERASCGPLIPHPSLGLTKTGRV